MSLDDELRQVGQERAEKSAELEPILERQVDVVRRAAGEGYTRRRIAELVGLSHQRVDQIIRSAG